jgi:hypothetical protein
MEAEGGAKAPVQVSKLAIISKRIMVVIGMGGEIIGEWCL